MWTYGKIHRHSLPPPLFVVCLLDEEHHPPWSNYTPRYEICTLYDLGKLLLIQFSYIPKYRQSMPNISQIH